MRKYIYIGLALLSLLVFIGVQRRMLKEARAERDTYKSNTQVLLGQSERYKTRDSLNALSVGVLELKLAEFERFRAQDAELIRTLRVERKQLEQVATTQLQTIYELRGSVRDSIIYADAQPIDTVGRLDIVDKWFELHGHIARDGEFAGTFRSLDSLLYVAHVEHKRFLGFLWRTRKIKSMRQEIVSHNPHTVILDAEFITIRK